MTTESDKPIPTSTALLATGTFILGALAGIASVFIASDPGRELEVLQFENQALHQRIDALERQLADTADVDEPTGDCGEAAVGKSSQSPV